MVIRRHQFCSFYALSLLQLLFFCNFQVTVKQCYDNATLRYQTLFVHCLFCVLCAWNLYIYHCLTSTVLANYDTYFCLSLSVCWMVDAVFFTQFFILLWTDEHNTSPDTTYSVWVFHSSHAFAKMFLVHYDFLSHTDVWCCFNLPLLRCIVSSFSLYILHSWSLHNSLLCSCSNSYYVIFSYSLFTVSRTLLVLIICCIFTGFTHQLFYLFISSTPSFPDISNPWSSCIPSFLTYLTMYFFVFPLLLTPTYPVCISSYSSIPKSFESYTHIHTLTGPLDMICNTQTNTCCLPLTEHWRAMSSTHLWQSSQHSSTVHSQIRVKPFR